jgi:hypothetical protein
MPEWIRCAFNAVRPRLGRAFNSQDPTLEVNLLAYGFGVVATAAWLTRWTIVGPRDGNLVAAIAAFLAAVTGGLFKKGAGSAAQQTTGAGAPDKDGGA